MRQALWLLLLPLAAAAGEGGPDVSGSVRAAWYGASARLDGREDVGAASVWLKATQDAGSAGYVVEAMLRNDDAGGGGPTSTRVREAYLRWNGEQLDVKLGRQLIVWGRADRLNPTDNITPRNYTWLTPEENDQRLGVLAASARYRWSGASLTLHYLPQPLANVLPIAPAPGLAMRERAASGGQGALKFDASGGQVDWSLSWFSGADINPDSRLELAGPAPALVFEHRRVHILGADAATVAGRYGLRAEAAYTWTGGGPDAPLVKKPFLYAVAGADRTFGEHLNLNLQLYFRRVAGWRDPRLLADPLLRAVALQGAVMSNQGARSDRGLSVRLADSWLNETVQGELALVWSHTSSAWALKPRLSWAIDDHWTATAGMDRYRGASETLFGQLRAASAAFVEIKRSF